MNLIQSVSFVSSTTESLRIPSHVLEAAHYFKEYCYEEIHFIIICHHWTLKIGISWRFTEHFAAVFSACRVSTQLPGVYSIITYSDIQVQCVSLLGLGNSRALQHPNSHVSIIYFLVPSCSLLELYWKQNVFYLKVHINIFLFPISRLLITPQKCYRPFLYFLNSNIYPTQLL